MASRQEEKERRRQERIAAEQAAAQKAAAGRRRIQTVLGAVLAIAAIGVVVAVIVLVAGGGSDDSKTSKPTSSSQASAPIPAQQVADLDEAAKASGCVIQDFPSEGREHSANPSDWKYKTNPPTSGTHNPEWAQDGVYAPGDEPPSGFTVHTLEHGRIDLQYSAKATPRQIAQLKTLFDENDGYHMLLFRNQTGMDATVAATAWTRSLTCKTFNPKVFDALRAFRDKYIDQGPESVP